MGVSFDFISTIFQLDVGTLRMVWNVLCFFMVVRIDDRDGSKSLPSFKQNSIWIHEK
jgi:hypothetical protein